jgi:hypothetical protein
MTYICSNQHAGISKFSADLHLKSLQGRKESEEARKCDSMFASGTAVVV